MLNGCARLRLEFIPHNHHNTPTFESWVVKNWLRSLCPTPKMSLYKLIQPFQISLTHPISHYKYDEWLEKVEIGVWSLKCVPQPIFWSWVGTILALSKSTFCTQIEYVHTDSWQFTASQPFQSLIISILNGCARMRLEFTFHNQHHTLIFESQVVKILLQGPYVLHQDWACTNWFRHFISALTFQSVILSIMNG